MTNYIDLRNFELATHSDSVVVVDIREAILPQGSDYEQLLYECLESYQHVTLVTCNAGIKHFDRFASDRFMLINYPLAFFYNHYNYLDPQQPLMPDRGFQYHFACYNNKAKPHRVQLIDYLYENGINNSSIVTWRSGKKYQNLLGVMPKHFDTEQPAKLDLENICEHGLTWLQIVSPPVGYDLCAVDLVTESLYAYDHTDTMFVTEKTVKPLWHGKLFLTLGLPGIHHWLKSQGFELYDEIFDYEFDLINNDYLRFRGYAANVKKLSQMSLDQIETVYQQLYQKIRHNANLARSIHSDLPDIIQDVNIDRDFFVRLTDQHRQELTKNQWCLCPVCYDKQQV